MSIEHVAKLGRSSLLNPSCPPVSSDAEHAKKHELVRAQVADRAKRKRELTNYARLKKPAVGKIDLNIATQGSLRTNGKCVADDEHPDHQHRINRRTANRRIKRLKLGIHPRQIENRSNLANRLPQQNLPQGDIALPSYLLDCRADFRDATKELLWVCRICIDGLLTRQ